MTLPVETVIGLEVHVQLDTRTKLFCGCPNRFGAPPNTHVCPVCYGLPGALPVPNRRAVELAVLAGLAFGCEVPEESIFERKNYFYPDLPKGYQITQFEHPVARAGFLPVAGRRIGIHRIQLEEDAGKLVHEGFAGSDRRSGVDFNRAGVPLIEIVSEPDLRSPAEAGAFARALKNRVVYCGVSDADMEKGNLRMDGNISVRRRGDPRFGVKVELKNLNSFRFLVRALEFEEARQRDLLAAGQPVVQETRLYDEASGATRAMRSKEEAADYRYFPDPDLPPLRLPPGPCSRKRSAGCPSFPKGGRTATGVTTGSPPGRPSGSPPGASSPITTKRRWRAQKRRAPRSGTPPRRRRAGSFPRSPPARSRTVGWPFRRSGWAASSTCWRRGSCRGTRRGKCSPPCAGAGAAPPNWCGNSVSPNSPPAPRSTNWRRASWPSTPPTGTPTAPARPR